MDRTLALAKGCKAPEISDGIDIAGLFDRGVSSTASQLRVSLQGAQREEWCGDGIDRLSLDRFNLAEASCCFLRLAAAAKRHVGLRLPGSYHLQACEGGGWILEPQGTENCSYWVPQTAVLRKLSQNGHILEEEAQTPSHVALTGGLSSVGFEIPAGWSLDLVLWRISREEKTFAAELSRLAAIEKQPIFLWGSHTTYSRPSDIYLHLVFGHVYENRFAWPYQRKICSENDAHALYVTMSGLQRATGKKLYSLLKQQLVLSVLARQSSDGGWHHGEWTDAMEAHLRLNGSAIHLLVDYLEEHDDPFVRQALKRAVDFVVRYRDETRAGTWFLHDALEMSTESMKKSPFHWAETKAFGKSPCNMLVLNTHLDTTVLLDRYQCITGDNRYSELIESARHATRAILNARPLGWLYAVLWKPIELTLLPTRVAKNLPLPLRALKRAAWKWFIPNFYRLTSHYPRLVMPGGYIERAAALKGMADDYHAINVMDLARYYRHFPGEGLSEAIDRAVHFVEDLELQEHWAERQEKKYALGFWAEALYHLCLLTPSNAYRAALAQTMLNLADAGLGLPPSVLGANAEAVGVKSQAGCPSPADARLKVANLSRADGTEFLVVNPIPEAVPLVLASSDDRKIVWTNSIGEESKTGADLEVPGRGWLHGRAGSQTEVSLSCALGS